MVRSYSVATTSLQAVSRTHSRLRNEKVQQLKDILNALYPPEPAPEDEPDTPAENGTVPSNEAPADGTAPANGTTAPVTPADTTPADPNGSGSGVDTMMTLPMEYEEWPPCPWIPKTSLRRWRKPINRQASSDFFLSIPVILNHVQPLTLFGGDSTSAVSSTIDPEA